MLVDREMFDELGWGWVLKTFTVLKSQNGESRYIIAMLSVQAIKNYHPAPVADPAQRVPDGTAVGGVVMAIQGSEAPL